MQQALAIRSAGPVSRVTRRAHSRTRRSFICRAEEVVEAKVIPPSTSTSLPVPDWLPAPAVPALEFLNKEDFKFTDSALYTNYIAKYLEYEYVSQSIGWKKLPETINGRLAMLGFVAGAGAEIFGAGSVLTQLSKFPQVVVFSTLLFTVASIIPVVKGTKGDYLESLKDQITIPEGVFTETLEKVHGRLAMLGLGGLLVVELFKGSPLL